MYVCVKTYTYNVIYTDISHTHTLHCGNFHYRPENLQPSTSFAARNSKVWHIATRGAHSILHGGGGCEKWQLLRSANMQTLNNKAPTPTR